MGAGMDFTLSKPGNEGASSSEANAQKTHTCHRGNPAKVHIKVLEGGEPLPKHQSRALAQDNPQQQQDLGAPRVSGEANPNQFLKAQPKGAQSQSKNPKLVAKTRRRGGKEV